MKMCFFYFYFLIVHISSNNVLGSLKLCMHVGNIHVEGTVSQIFSLYLSYYLIQKTGNFLSIFVNIFSRFYRKKTRTYIHNLRHSSLDSNVFYMYAKFQGCNLHNNRDIHVQKIKI